MLKCLNITRICGQSYLKSKISLTNYRFHVEVWELKLNSINNTPPSFKGLGAMFSMAFLTREPL